MKISKGTGDNYNQLEDDEIFIPMLAALDIRLGWKVHSYEKLNELIDSLSPHIAKSSANVKIWIADQIATATKFLKKPKIFRKRQAQQIENKAIELLETLLCDEDFVARVAHYRIKSIRSELTINEKMAFHNLMNEIRRV
jgi:signal recognition particle GTPase